MYVPSFIKIERGSDGAYDFKYNNVPFLLKKSGNINTSMFADPKPALVPATWHIHCGMTSLHRSNNGLLAHELVSGQ